MKTIVCKRCGQKVEVETRSFKYCPECRIIVDRELARAARKRRYETTTVTMSADTDEMRNLCLNCTRPRCCGECAELANIAKRYSNDNDNSRTDSTA